MWGAITGLPERRSYGYPAAGKTAVMRQLAGVWDTIAIVPSPDPMENGRFGEVVAVHKAPARGYATLAIAQTGSFTVFVFVSVEPFDVWQLEATLSTDVFTFPQDSFGAALALEYDFLGVGVPGAEAVVVFERTVWYDGSASWDNGTVLHASDYDYDIINAQPHLHTQSFGASIALQNRMLLVGAPQAGYDKVGTSFVENYKTDGYPAGTGRGQVYTFYR